MTCARTAPGSLLGWRFARRRREGSGRRLPTGRTPVGSPLQLGPSQRHWRSGGWVGTRVAHTTDGSGATSIRQAGSTGGTTFAAGSFHRAHFNGQLLGANDGTGSAWRSVHLQEMTGHARKEGLRSAAQAGAAGRVRAAALLAVGPAQGHLGCRILAWVPVTGAHRRCAARCRFLTRRHSTLGSWTLYSAPRVTGASVALGGVGRTLEMTAPGCHRYHRLQVRGGAPHADAWLRLADLGSGQPSGGRPTLVFFRASA